MYQYKHEEVAWQRLQDVQREMENSRQLADGLGRAMSRFRLLARRAWWLGGIASIRPPRRRPALEDCEMEDSHTASGAA
ncbi:MAG TPA: hypothetical protein VGG90_12315 [Candidatus Dormibacteraeota bacterium]|jgi:hypothetical protein